MSYSAANALGASNRSSTTTESVIELDQSFHYISEIITPVQAPTPTSSGLCLVRNGEDLFEMLARAPVRSNSFPNISNRFSGWSSRNISSSTNFAPLNVSETLVNADNDYSSSVSIQESPLSKYADTLEALQTHRLTKPKSTVKPFLADFRNGVRSRLMKVKRAIKDVYYDKQKALEFKIAARKMKKQYGPDRRTPECADVLTESDEDGSGYPLTRVCARVSDTAET